MTINMEKIFKPAIAIIFSLNFCLPVLSQTIESQQSSFPSSQAPNYAHNTNQAAFLSNESTALREAGKLQEAKAKLEEACLLDPNQNSAVVHSNLGLTLLQMGNIDQSRTEFFKALSFNSDMPVALYSIGSCYFQERNVDQAKYYLQEFLKKYPEYQTSDAAKRMLVSLQNVTRLADDPNASDYYPSAVTNKIAKWSLDKMPLKIFIESGKHVDGYQSSFNYDLITALDKWMSASDHLLSWQLTSKKKKADIICHWCSDKHTFMEPNGAELGQTLSKSLLDPRRPYQNFIKDVDMSLCTKNLDGTKVLNDEQMTYLCLHEVGHALGIKTHSSNGNDVMFFMMKSHVSTDLSNRDKATILRLYSTR